MARRFRDADVDDLLRLWRVSHAGVTGDVSRTAEYWRWCVRNRPGVGRDNIVVVELAGQVAGYAAVETGEPVARVLEFVVDPGIPRRRRRQIVGVLVRLIERRAGTEGSDLIRLHVPPGDREVDRVLRAHMYAPGPFHPPLQWAIVDLPTLLSSLLVARKHRLPTGWSRVFVLDAAPGGRDRALRWRLEVDAAAASVSAVAIDQEVVGYPVIRTDLSTLTGLLFRTTTFDQEAAAGRLRVDPPWATDEAATLLELLASTKPRHTPLADVR